MADLRPPGSSFLLGLPAVGTPVEGDVLMLKNGRFVASQLAPSNQGETRLVFDSFTNPGDFQTQSTSFVAVAGTTPASGTFNAPYAGRYLLVLTTSVFRTTGDCDAAFRIAITGATTKTVGAENSPADTTEVVNWVQQLRGTAAANFTAIAVVELAAGLHTMALQVRRSFDAGSNGAVNISPGTTCQLGVVSIGGGATGYFAKITEKHFANSPSPDFFQWSLSYAAVVSGSFTVPATGKYRLRAQMSGTSISTANNTYNYRLKIDGVVVTQDNESAADYTWFACDTDTNDHVLFDGGVDVILSAGTHTYALEVKSTAGSNARSDAKDRLSLWIEGGSAFQQGNLETPYRITKIASRTLRVSPTQGSALALQFNDNTLRTHASTIDTEFLNGTLGIGQGDQSGWLSANTWYYLYAVPVGASDFGLIVSANPPNHATTPGPIGYTRWRYLGAWRSDAGLNITDFVHDGDTFYWRVAQNESAISTFGTLAQAQQNVTVAMVPGTAAAGVFQARLVSGAGAAQQDFYVDGAAGGAYWFRNEAPFNGDKRDAFLRIPFLPGLVPTVPRRIQYGSSGQIASQELFTLGWSDGYIFGAAPNTAFTTQTGVGSAAWKDSVRALATTNVSVSSAPAAIDGVTLSSGDRIALTGQTTASENGIWRFNGAAAALTRPTDFDQSDEVLPGLVFTVQEGTSNADSVWILTTDGPIVLGSTSLAFAKVYPQAAAADTGFRAPARAVATSNVSVSSAPATIDGVTLTNGDRVLLTAQTTGSENGLWVFNGSGSALTRPTDYAATMTTIPGSLLVAVQEGTNNPDSVWMLTTNGLITPNTTSTAWLRIFPLTTPYTFKGQYHADEFNASVAIDWNNGNVQYVDMANGSNTFTFANPKAGARYMLILRSSGASTTATWPAAVLWPGGVAPTITAVNGKFDVVTFVYEGTNAKYLGSYSQNY